jgi:hypothetical protein
MSEFSQLKLGILEKPFSLETLRRKLANIQGTRKLSGGLGDIAQNKADANGANGEKAGVAHSTT